MAENVGDTLIWALPAHRRENEREKMLDLSWIAIIWAAIVVGVSLLAAALLDVEVDGTMMGAAGSFLVGVACGVLVKRGERR